MNNAARLRDRWPFAVIAALAYVPALLSSPGRMPADSKLYLYLDPGRLLADAGLSFDPRQFAGWVPHQHISYLWPAGPFYWLGDAIGLPDWVVHRLWIGSVLFAAGAGVLWCARRFGLGVWAALAAALVYQLSPYILPYVSRTSVMLLPWAGLGWVLGLTFQATRIGEGASRWRRWREPALIALVVATVGAVNATALAMIVPAPLVLLLFAGFERWTAWRRLLSFTLRTGLLCVGVSMWWIAMLMIQSSYGADVLPYSEALADVSFTSTAPEIWRSLGYWLFYVSDTGGVTTSSALPYMNSGRVILASFAIPLLALASAVLVEWRYRRFALACIAGGALLAVGVHPIDDPAPLLDFVTGGGENGLALALRSSTRALPVMVLGLALLIGAGTEAFASRKLPFVGWRADVAAAALVGLLALVNLPSLWHTQLVDPAIDRDQSPPAAWFDAAAFIDSGEWGPPADGRLLQLPGIEFGAFDWGYTVDQPLPSLTDKPLVTRDLLPLGSPAAMDLLYAFDDRIQNGVLEHDELAPVAKLLGTDTVWLTGDVDWRRFDSARPSSIADAVTASAEQVRTFGDGTQPPAEPTVLDERTIAGAITTPEVGIAPTAVGGDDGGSQVLLADLGEEIATVRAKAGVIAVSGSGDGLVDSGAVHDLIDRYAMRYTADADEPLARADALVVTDSNRNRNRHWRSSQDATGATLTADAAVPSAEAERRLPVFDTDDPTTRSNTVHQGGIDSVTASAYGEPWGYLPEHRPAMAFDDSSDTAWMVGDHGDPLGASISFVPEQPVDAMTLEQYAPVDGQRTIDELTISIESSDRATEELSVVLDPDPAVPNPVDVEIPAGSTVTLTIEAVTGGEPLTRGIVSGVGFRHIDLGIAPIVEHVQLPTNAVATSPEFPVAYSMSRERVDPLDHWRDDPEPALARSFVTGADDTYSPTVDVRLDRRMADQRLAEMLGWPAYASSRLTGSLRHAGVHAIDDDPSTSWTTAFDDADGARLTVSGVSEPIDRVAVTQLDGQRSQVNELRLVAGNGDERTVTLGADDGTGRRTATVEPPLGAGEVTVELVGVEARTVVDRRFGDVRELPVSIAELELPGTPVVPEPALAGRLADCVELVAIEGADRHTVTARLGLGDDALDGALLDVELCDPAPVALRAGDHSLTGRGAPHGLDVDAVELRNAAFDELVATSPDAPLDELPNAVEVERSPTERTITVTGCPDGCWLTFGEGYSTGWTASVDGRSLSEPTLLDGGFNGWWLAGDATVQVAWGPQHNLDLALILSLLVVMVCTVLVGGAFVHRVNDDHVGVPRPGWDPFEWIGRTEAGLLLALWAVAASLLVAPLWGLWAAGAGALALVVRRRRVVELTAFLALLVVACVVFWTERGEVIDPNSGWPRRFDDYHRLALFAIATCGVAAVVPARRGHSPS